MRYLTVGAVLHLHEKLIAQSGGSAGLRDRGLLESAVAQPRMAFGGQPLYPTLIEKAAALGFSLIKNHPFVDGNKRIGHFAIVSFLRMNGHKVVADVDDQEKIILAVAAGEMDREPFTEWLRKHVVAL
jgi:death-on-curing protein